MSHQRGQGEQCGLHPEDARLHFGQRACQGDCGMWHYVACGSCESRLLVGFGKLFLFLTKPWLTSWRKRTLNRRRCARPQSPCWWCRSIGGGERRTKGARLGRAYFWEPDGEHLMALMEEWASLPICVSKRQWIPIGVAECCRRNCCLPRKPWWPTFAPMPAMLRIRSHR